MPELLLRHHHDRSIFSASALAARPAEERDDRSGEMVHARRDRVTAVVALGMGFFGLMAAMRALDHVVMVALFAHWDSVET